jgi:hypothetical protein
MLIYLLVLIFSSCSAAAIAAPESAYERLMQRERAATDDNNSKELIASGSAAILIGLYGYYNTSPSVVVKMLYAATQTAGVLTISHAIKTRNQPKLSVVLDERMRAGNPLSKKEWEDLMVSYDLESTRAQDLTNAYSAGVLTGLYLYNAARETSNDKTLRNAYLFLGVNFAVGSAVSFYKVYHPQRAEGAFNGESFGWNFAMNPWPDVAFRF